MSEFQHIVTQAEIDDAVRRIDALPGGDPESTHGVVDDVLMELVPADVHAAVERAIEREDGRWWYA